MTPLILASQSASRRAMLDAAGVSYTAIPAHVDEARIKDELVGGGAGLSAIAGQLAMAKALAISAGHPGRWVIGSDSLVSLDGRIFDKPQSRADAAHHLTLFSGKRMQLVSALALARDGAVVEEVCDEAHLEVRPLSAAFIEHYLDAEWPAIAGCVGCFRIEARGPQLFERVSGSHFTILGMPLLPLLSLLRTNGIIAA